MNTKDGAAEVSSKTDAKSDLTKSDKLKERDKVVDGKKVDGKKVDGKKVEGKVVDGAEDQGWAAKWSRRIARILIGVFALFGVLWVIDQFRGEQPSLEPSEAAVANPVLGGSGTGVLASERGFGFVDLFERPGDDTWLGDVSVNNSWLEITGTWESADGIARVVEPSERGPSIAVYNLGTPDATIEAEFEDVEVGSGLVFRFRNVLNHWQVRAAPAAGTWVVVRVAEGEATTVGTLGLAAIESGTRIAVALDGDRILFYVDGLFKAEVIDSSFQNATRVGLLAQPLDATSYRSFVAIGHSKNAFGTDPNGPDPDDADFIFGDDPDAGRDDEE